MSKPSDPKWTNAFTRASVEAYLDAADAECVRLQAAIAAARARTERALARQQQLDASGVDPAWNGEVVAADGVGSRQAIADRLGSAIADQTFWLHPDAAAVSRD